MSRGSLSDAHLSLNTLASVMSVVWRNAKLPMARAKMSFSSDSTEDDLIMAEFRGVMSPVPLINSPGAQSSCALSPWALRPEGAASPTRTKSRDRVASFGSGNLDKLNTEVLESEYFVKNSESCLADFYGAFEALAILPESRVVKTWPGFDHKLYRDLDKTVCNSLQCLCASVICIVIDDNQAQKLNVEPGEYYLKRELNNKAINAFFTKLYKVSKNKAIADVNKAENAERKLDSSSESVSSVDELKELKALAEKAFTASHLKLEKTSQLKAQIEAASGAIMATVAGEQYVPDNCVLDDSNVLMTQGIPYPIMCEFKGVEGLLDSASDDPKRVSTFQKQKDGFSDRCKAAILAIFLQDYIDIVEAEEAKRNKRIRMRYILRGMARQKMNEELGSDNDTLNRAGFVEPVDNLWSTRTYAMLLMLRMAAVVDIDVNESNVAWGMINETIQPFMFDFGCAMGPLQQVLGLQDMSADLTRHYHLGGELFMQFPNCSQGNFGEDLIGNTSTAGRGHQFDDLWRMAHWLKTCSDAPKVLEYERGIVDGLIRLAKLSKADVEQAVVAMGVSDELVELPLLGQDAASLEAELASSNIAEREKAQDIVALREKHRGLIMQYGHRYGISMQTSGVALLVRPRTAMRSFFLERIKQAKAIVNAPEQIDALVAQLGHFEKNVLAKGASSKMTIKQLKLKVGRLLDQRGVGLRREFNKAFNKQCGPDSGLSVHEKFKKVKAILLEMGQYPRRIDLLCDALRQKRCDAVSCTAIAASGVGVLTQRADLGFVESKRSDNKELADQQGAFVPAK